MNFQLTSKYKPTGDQPQAIRQLTEGIKAGDPAQVLLGVTGSGKTFTVANVIANVNKPTLVLSHNKTLAAQLYEEMKGFFPNNAVDYYVSYYDYYQPEAYLPATDLYIEKDLAINEEIDKLRLAAVSDLLSGRQDVIVVSSVSCIYGMGGPVAMQESIIDIKQGEKIDRNVFLRKLVTALYVRNDIDLQRGCFSVNLQRQHPAGDLVGRRDRQHRGMRRCDHAHPATIRRLPYLSGQPLCHHTGADQQCREPYPGRSRQANRLLQGDG